MAIRLPQEFVERMSMAEGDEAGVMPEVSSAPFRVRRTCCALLAALGEGVETVVKSNPRLRPSGRILGQGCASKRACN